MKAATARSTDPTANSVAACYQAAPGRAGSDRHGPSAAGRRSLGVADVVECKRRSLINFRSWRRWLTTKMNWATVDGDLIALIVGPERSGLILGRYSEGQETEAAKVAIARVRPSSLDSSPIKAAQPLRGGGRSRV